ncbi:acyl-CoA dehydrogenase [Siminovitchia sediminis]|uniref:Acyl-CoA dehydrogenase n=1 Tax=Siminovitchia sediminis TaxID=1274353 RepID=A0ABW4KK95_9BACI
MVNLTVEKAFNVEELFAAARKVGEVSEKEYKEAEANATVSQNVIDAIKDADIHNLLLPKSYGGPQIDLKTYAKLIRIISKHNPSAGWLASLYSIHNVWVSYLPKKARDEVAGKINADIFAPVGKVTDSGDHYILSGTYNFVSGCLYSDWIGVNAMIFEKGNSIPQQLCLVVQASDIKIVKNWDTLGLRGTGSNQIILENVRVPKYRVLNITKIHTEYAPPEDLTSEDYPLFDMPFYSTTFMGFPNVALGGAQRLLEEFKKFTEKRTRLDMDGMKEKEHPRSQRVYATLQMKYIQAETLMNRYIEMLEQFDRDGDIGPADFGAIRAEIIQHCVDIATKVLLVMGGFATYRGNPVELFVRDVLCVGTHTTSLYEDQMSHFGRKLFGFDTTFALG